jgi:signal transduction histidine kinase
MTPLQQLLLVSILPLSFLGMLVYLWLRSSKRRQVLYRWSFVLLAAAVWASSVLRFYGDGRFSPVLIFNWSIVGAYAFSLAALGVLLTTKRYMFVAARPGNTALVISLILWSGALALDPLVLRVEWPTVVLAGQPMRQFDLWAGVWIASWFVPLVAASMLTSQMIGALPVSLYRNQIRYWLLTLFLFAIGGALASIRQPGQPVWQELGMLVVLLAAGVGTTSLTQGQLPDLQIAVRQLIYRLAGTLTVFAVVWLALTLALRSIAHLPTNSDPNLILIMMAALLAVLLMGVYRLVNQLARRLFLPSAVRQEAALADYAQAMGSFPEPAQLGGHFLRVLQATLGADEATLLAAEDGPGGILVLRPLTTLNAHPLETAAFAVDSPITQHLRQETRPLVQYDVDALEHFDAIPAREKETLVRWQQVLYAPLRSGRVLVGVVALGRKYTCAPYDRADYAQLAALCNQIAPLLAQAQHMAGLHGLNDYVFTLNQMLARQNRQLVEAVNLYDQYVALVGPDLKRPFATIANKLLQLQDGLAQEPAKQNIITTLNQEFAGLRQPIENLINLAARVQVSRDFTFQLVYLDDVIQAVQRNLATMAEARRVAIEYEPDRTLPPVLGDPEQLQEAVLHLLHNAIKFNKIGGRVRLETAICGGDLRLRLEDTGVGIPEERLGAIWQGLAAFRHNGDGKKRPGVGLTLTHFIIAAHGGRVEATSNYGAGSVFTIYLPLVFDG